MKIVCVGNRMLGNRQARMHASILLIKIFCKIKTLGRPFLREHTQGSVKLNYGIEVE